MALMARLSIRTSSASSSLAQSYYKVLSEVPDLLVDGCHNPFLLVVDFIIPTHEVALNVPVFEVNVEFGLEQGKFLLDHADFPTVFPNGLGR